MTTTTTTTTPNRAQRRTRQTAQPRASRDVKLSATPSELDALSAVVGEPVTLSDIAEAQAAVDTVNLDELIAPTVRVAFMERTPVEDLTLDDGSVVTRYQLAPRVATITLWASVDAQLTALALNRQRKTKPIEEQVPEMIALLLTIWKLSEPDMTAERLRAGLDINKIAKLFNMAFTPPSRH